MTTYIQPNQNEKNAWAAMAQAAYTQGRNDIGHKFSAAASMPNGARTSSSTFDKLQSQYRAWLIDNIFAEEV